MAQKSCLVAKKSMSVEQTALFALTVEELSAMQDVSVVFNRNHSESVWLIVEKENQKVVFQANALLENDQQPLIEYLAYESTYSPVADSTTLLIPKISITTFCALVESSFSNTIKLGLKATDFASQFRLRVERLTL